MFVFVVKSIFLERKIFSLEIYQRIEKTWFDMRINFFRLFFSIIIIDAAFGRRSMIFLTNGLFKNFWRICSPCLIEFFQIHIIFHLLDITLSIIFTLINIRYQDKYQTPPISF